MDESEPGRCRRTDGKKWRCKKEVIPNEKYCEKHMHRGCRRGSRKLVESSYSNKLTLLPTSTTTTTAAGNHSSKKNPSSDAIKPNNALSSSNESRPKLGITPPPQPKSSSPLSLQLKIQPLNGTTSSHYENIAVSRVKEEVKKGGCETAKHYPVMPKIEIKSAAPPAAVSAASVGREHFNLSRKSRDMVKVGGDGSDCRKVEEIMIDENTKSKSRNGGVTTSVSSGLDFSPKSVLRDGQVCSSLLLNQNKSAADLHMLQSRAEHDHPQRCRRTDGKRWRCSKEVVSSDEKYCAKHMHRGAKKQRPAMVSSSPYCSSNNGGRSDCNLSICSNLDHSAKQAKKVVLGMDN